ncbi:MAG TPA: hypothetical protein VKZ77_13465 [Bacillaceae bacterium]|nr:hypothetical protein [Paenibacillus bovis]HLU23467.1 hypothetical protein [Bacillaceae bacterium]
MTNKFKKVFGIVIAGIMLLAITNSVSAASSQSGELNGARVSGYITINASSASASTGINLPPNTLSSVSVDITYYYRDKSDGKILIPSTGGGGGNIAVTVTRPNPDTTRYSSDYAIANHTVRYSGQTWTAKTNKTYY